jgi:hypothetical protein
MFDMSTAKDFERFMLHAEVVLFIKTYGPRYNCYFTPVMVKMHVERSPGPPVFSLFSDMNFRARIKYWDPEVHDEVYRPISSYLNARDRMWRDHEERPIIDLTPLGSPEMTLAASSDSDEMNIATSDFEVRTVVGEYSDGYYDSDDI